MPNATGPYSFRAVNGRCRLPCGRVFDVTQKLALRGGGKQPQRAIDSIVGCYQWPGRTSTFGFAGSVPFDTTMVGTSLKATSHSARARVRKRSSV